MTLFKKRPKARIKLRDTFAGKEVSAIAEGYVIYKEWDPLDREFYYWEEWELRGFNDYDSWVEYDHYTQEVTLYEPLKPQEFIDPTTLKVGDAISFTTRYGHIHHATITEVGVGTVVRREGTLTWHVFEKEPVAYAEASGPRGHYSIEKYNDQEFDIYKGRILSRAEQRIVLGRSVSPVLSGKLKATTQNVLWSAFVIAILGISLYDEVRPQYTSFCTPRTITPSKPSSTVPAPGPAASLTAPSITNPHRTPQPSTATGAAAPITPPTTPVLPSDEITDQTPTQTCYRRRIYGGSGSGGVGK